MSGDVQPRKRKDKKKKKDELGFEEPRGTAAVFEEGDVFIHSYHEHGTGGHWCAKIIFFSLLAVLVTLIGLIILENRGLSELEANAVESRYSGVLEGWIEDVPEDHHDEHTLELKHTDDEDIEDTENDDEDELDDDEDEHNESHDDEDELDDDEGEHYESHEDDDDENDEENSEVNEDEIEEEDSADIAYSAYKQDENLIHTESDENDEIVKDHYKYEESDERDDDDENEESEDNNNIKIKHNGDYVDNDDEKWQQEEEHEEDVDDDDDDEEVERLEREISDEDIVSSEVLEDQTVEDDDGSEEDDDQSTQVDDEDEPPVERITMPPSGKPYTEIDEETVQKTPDTLADEEVYEKQQEELKKERESQSSQGMWLKLLVGGALLAATHAVVRRATAPRDEPEEEHFVNEPSVSDRRMTLIPQTEKSPENLKQITLQEDLVKSASVMDQSVVLPKLIPEDDKIVNVSQEDIGGNPLKDENDRELYSDEEEEEDEIDEEEEEEEVEEIVVKKPNLMETKAEPINKSAKPVEEPQEEDEDVEIIDEEEIEEELEDEEEEEEVEEEISDVDDSDLLNRLEAKYGRLPEPERPGKYKGGGNSIEDDWPGEPNDPYWSQQLDLAEEELRQGWLE